MDLETSIKVHKILTWNFPINNIEHLKILMSKEYEIKLIKGLQENEYKELSTVFYLIEKQNWISCYKRIFKYISTDDIRYDLFKDIYSCSEGNFKFNNKILINIRKTFQRLHSQLLSNGTEYITIYKATDNHLNNIKKSLSWTTDKEKAIWFSKNIFKCTFMYQGIIKQSNIIYSVEDKKEREILARYKDIEEVIRIPITQ